MEGSDKITVFDRIDNIQTRTNEGLMSTERITQNINEVTDKVLELANIREKRKAFEAMAKVASQKIKEDAAIKNHLITQTAKKHNKLMNSAEKVLDEGLTKNNTELIVKALDVLVHASGQSIAEEVSKVDSISKNVIEQSLLDDDKSLPWADL